MHLCGNERVYYFCANYGYGTNEIIRYRCSNALYCISSGRNLYRDVVFSQWLTVDIGKSYSFCYIFGLLYLYYGEDYGKLGLT